MHQTATLVENLRVAADLIASHPDLPMPVVTAFTAAARVDVTWQLMNIDGVKHNQKAAAQRILRAVGGQWDKNPWDNRFDFSQERDGLRLSIYAEREQVCERRVVGTKTVTTPAVEAQPERTETVELVEWDCSPILADAAEQVSA